MLSLGRVIVVVAVAKVLTLLGLTALIVASLLSLNGVSAAWLAWAGGWLSVGAFATAYLLARGVQPNLDRVAQEGVTTIYMPLLNEGVPVWRPVAALKITDLGYMVTENAPPDEQWAFEPGKILRCEKQQLAEGPQLVAVAKAT